MKVSELQKNIVCRLEPVVGRGEADAMVRIMFEHLLGYQPVDIVLHGNRDLEDFTVERFDEVASRVLIGEPLQYVLGVARFMGNDFKVDHSTLIPRPETAGLVDMVVDENGDHTDLRVLDVGTGSGCIAIMLARGLKFADVTGVDISEDAIAVARENAARLSPRNVRFVVADALVPSTMPSGPFDIIVSNPPYIANREASDMERHVLDHEPHSALFVSDDDPLLFYRAIAEFGRDALNIGGRLYFEINPMFADDLKLMIQRLGYTNVDVVRDYLGRLRFLSCVRS